VKKSRLAHIQAGGTRTNDDPDAFWANGVSHHVDFICNLSKSDISQPMVPTLEGLEIWW
jgi:hypothetical protein